MEIVTRVLVTVFYFKNGRLKSNYLQLIYCLNNTKLLTEVTCIASAVGITFCGCVTYKLHLVISGQGRTYQGQLSFDLYVALAT